MKLKDGFVTYTQNGIQMMVAAGPAAQAFSGLVRSNETAAFMIDCLKRDVTEAEIVDAVLAEYDAPRTVIERDVRDVLDKLRGIGAIE